MQQTPRKPLFPNTNYSTGAPTLSSPHACGGDPAETSFRKNEANRHPSTSTRVSSQASGTNRGISPSTGQKRKNKPNLKIDKPPCPRIVTHLPFATSPGASLPLMPQCLTASVPCCPSALLPQCLATSTPRPLFGKTNPIDTLQHGLGCRPERVERVEGSPPRPDKNEKTKPISI